MINLNPVLGYGAILRIWDSGQWFHPIEFSIEVVGIIILKKVDVNIKSTYELSWNNINLLWLHKFYFE